MHSLGPDCGFTTVGQRGGSSAEAAAVAAERQRDFGGSLVAARRQWQRLRRWR